MKCPICNKRIRVYPGVQVAGVVKEWIGRCESKKHTVTLYSATREGLAKELTASQSGVEADAESRCGQCGKITSYGIGICNDCAR